MWLIVLVFAYAFFWWICDTGAHDKYWSENREHWFDEYEWQNRRWPGLH